MSFDALYPTIAGDLRISPTPVDGGEGFALTRTDFGEDVLVALARIGDRVRISFRLAPTGTIPFAETAS